MNRRAVLCSIAGTAAAAVLMVLPAGADTFGKVYYDRQNDQLVVTMHYRGTNPNHGFTLKWGPCQTNQSGALPGVTAEVLDDQFQDSAQQDFNKTTRFDMSNLPCRPARLTLRSAPRFIYGLTIR
jgi:hypothetical protein